MVNGLRIFLHRIDPGFENFQNEKIVLADQSGIDDLAFEIGEAFGDEWRDNLLGRNGCQTEFLELIHFSAGAIANANDFACQFARRNGNDAFLCRA